MIPILYERDISDLSESGKGIGVLSSVASCVVTEERNGIFELKMEYPVDGAHFKEITVDRLILAKPNQRSEYQLFRIYNVTKPMNGIVTVNAEHVSYMLSSIIMHPFSSQSLKETFQAIPGLSFSDVPFYFRVADEDEQNSPTGTLERLAPSSIRSLLGGSKGSILDTYGGEYEFDNFNVYWHKERGKDNGVMISYAKNLTGFKCEETSSDIVTGAVAYWEKEDENGNLQSVYGSLQTISTPLSYSRNVVVDCSSEFESEPSQSSLNNFARQYIQNHKNAPYYSIAVEFVNLGDTEEYKHLKGLEQVNLCDTVTVRHPIYNINVKEKVVKTVYDSIAEKYIKIELGSSNRRIYL